MTKFQFKMADGRHIGNGKNTITRHINEPIWTKLEQSHPILSPTCSPWCGCHGNGRCLATAHWTFSSYWRLEAEPNAWTNFAESWYNSTFGTRWQLLDSIVMKMFKFMIADSRHTWKCLKCHNSPINGPIWTKLWWSHVTDMSVVMRLLW